ncbi:recombinase family protein [uncultured Winogradskyella sp.]|uniref:recombinase family protein n=1 Tax=uncultured Winogradskyella sp. TaxID=395353 RepID=UPI00262234F0|nr:recombinase family protein [uncultured Winogradskyella sp.]
MLGIYCRRSGSNDKSASIEVQREEGLSFAKSLGYDNPEIYEDVAISGTKNEIKDRPSFARLYDDIDKGRITAVYAIDQSRIERNSMVWNLFVHIMIERKCLYYPNGQEFNLEDPNNKFLTQVLSASNELYASLTSQKVKLAHYKNVSNGKTHGLLPYGYQRDKNGFYEVVQEEAEVIRRIYNLSLEGNGTYTIANILNKENTPTKFNRFKGTITRIDKYTKNITEHSKEAVKWRGNVIYDMIVNTVYKGKRKWKDEYFDIPAIVEVDQWEAVNKNLKKNKKNVGKRPEYSYLLNGIIYCGHCGKEYRGKKRPKGNDNAYKCTGRRPPNSSCTLSRGISLAKIETFIVKHLFHKEDFKKGLLEQKTESTEQSKLQKRLSDKQNLSGILEKKLKLAGERLLDPDFTDDPFVKENYLNVKKQIQQNKEEIVAIQEQLAVANNETRRERIKQIFEDYTDNIDFTDLKALVHSLIKRITVHWNIDDFGKGYYIFQIDYKLSNERFLFTTNRTAMNWLLLTRYRKSATNEEELQEDKELAQEMGWTIDDDFEGLEVVGGDYDLGIKLLRDEFIHFD